MIYPEPNITVNVDVTNPGQFFACCGLLELADRLWPGAEGWFEGDLFSISGSGTTDELLPKISEAKLIQLEPENDTSSSIRVAAPIELELTWWQDDLAGGKALKVWAGSMRNVRIARAMQNALASVPDTRQLLNFACVVYDPDNPRKKVEPFYFDCRRGWNSQSIDIGFAPDTFNMTSAAFPAVEFLCLVGLQRFRPIPTGQRRIFMYRTWPKALRVEIAPAAACGILKIPNARTYRFEAAFRTDQRKHKAFFPATPIGDQV